MGRRNHHKKDGNIIQKLYIPNMLLLPKSLITARREWEYESK